MLKKNTNWKLFSSLWKIKTYIKFPEIIFYQLVRPRVQVEVFYVYLCQFVNYLFIRYHLLWRSPWLNSLHKNWTWLTGSNALYKCLNITTTYSTWIHTTQFWSFRSSFVLLFVSMLQFSTRLLWWTRSELVWKTFPIKDSLHEFVIRKK